MTISKLDVYSVWRGRARSSLDNGTFAAFSKLMLASNRASSLITSRVTANKAGHISRGLKYSETRGTEVNRRKRRDY